jgi:O-antigen/teichoic acid export membrane protein
MQPLQDTQQQGKQVVINLAGLRGRVIQAGAWTVGGHVAGQVIRLGSNLIMTRLLVPEMFGVMVLANVLLIGLNLFSDLGLNQNVIQSKRGRDEAFLNTVWTVQILRGVLICMLALVMAFGIQLAALNHWVPENSVYAAPLLPYVVAAFSVTAVIAGLESTKIATANRNLAMQHVVKLELTSQITGFVVMVLWAWADRTIWALVAGGVAAAGMRTLLSHLLLSGQQNRLHWDRAAFVEIYHFGKWVFLTSILGFLAMNGDRLILGWLADTSVLGMYAIAFLIISAIQQTFSRVINRVGLPALSEVARDRPEALKDVYYKLRAPVDLATLFAMGLLLACGHQLIDVLYDDRYLPAGHMLEILSIALFEVRYNIVGQCLIALGKPRSLAPMIVMRLVALYGLMPVAYVWYGLDGAIWVAGGSAFAGLPLIFYLKVKYGWFDWVKEVRVLPALIAGYAMGYLANWAFLRVAA